MAPPRDYATIGRTELPGYRIALEARPWVGDPPLDTDALKLLCLGRGSWELEDDRGLWGHRAPVLLCLGPKDRLRTVRSDDAGGWLVSFHPELINPGLDWDAVGRSGAGLDALTYQDYCLIEAFTRPSALVPGPLTLTRAQALFGAMASDLGDQADGYWPCRSRARLLELVVLVDSLYRSKAEGDPGWPPGTEGPLARALSYIHARYGDRPSLAEVCRAAGLNRNALERTLREATGMTFAAYLGDLRMRVASRMLRETGLPVAEIMGTVGIGDPSHFARTFKARFGESPRSYRDHHKSW